MHTQKIIKLLNLVAPMVVGFERNGPHEITIKFIDVNFKMNGRDWKDVVKEEFPDDKLEFWGGDENWMTVKFR